MKLYRLEEIHDIFKNGVYWGVYRASIAEYLFGTSDCYNNNSGTSPAPFSDPKLSNTWLSMDYGQRQNHVFAFESIESLLRWFYIKDNLKEHSDIYQLVEYELKDKHIRMGTAQCVFHVQQYIKRTVLDNSILWKE